MMNRIQVLAGTSLFPILLGLSACNPRRPQEPPVPQTLLAHAPPAKALLNEVIRLQPSAGHHFNLEAPNACGSGNMQEKTPRAIACQLTSPGAQTITVSICDDAKSFCKVEKHSVTVSGEPKSAGTPSRMSAPPRAASSGSKEFIQNDPAGALAKAKSEKKLLLIDFSAVWCPPCNLLEELVFNREEFRKASGDFVRVQLDVDSDASWEWKERFRIGGYPTLVIADADLEEIGRLVGYRPLPALNRWLEAQKKLKSSPISRTTDRRRRGTWHLDRGEYAEAVAELKGLKEPEARLALARAELELLKKDDEKIRLADKFDQLAREFPGEIEYASWVLELLDLDLARGKLLFPNALRSLESWRKSPRLAEKDYSVGDLHWIEAELWDKSGDAERSKKSFAEAAKAYALLAENSPLGVSRGANLEVPAITRRRKRSSRGSPRNTRTNSRSIIISLQLFSS